MESPLEPVEPPSGDEMQFVTRRTRWKLNDPPRPKTTEPHKIEDQDAPIFRLPSEISYQILTFLDARTLVALTRTCRQMRSAASEDLLWAELLRPHLPPADFPNTPSPLNSYKELFIAQYPYWFLPRNRIWISDDPHVGRVILCKYDPRRGCIEGYRLLAERGPSQSMLWPYKPRVAIHTFDPNVHLWLEDPVLKLPHDIVPLNTKQGFWEGELRMSVGRPGHDISASFFLSRNLPPESVHPGMDIWPPRTIPNMPRVRAASVDNFRGKGYKPQSYDEISQTTFRMRHWSQYAAGISTFGIRIGEEVSTWSTIDPGLYMPTKQKPYQGIFVGDYAGHGCEFLLVMQTEKAPKPPAQGDWSRFNRYRLGEGLGPEEEEEEEEEDAEMQLVAAAVNADFTGNKLPALPLTERNVEIPQNAAVKDDDSIFVGALEAVKLTGDPNVPRGEHTFIADDIGPNGFIRNALEKPFVGARVVKSRGHVAARGFIHDEFIPSQLMLIDHDRLAQYWVPFGHISFYQRVDIDQLMDGTFGRRSSQ